MKEVVAVSATRFSREEFAAKAPLSWSLRQIGQVSKVRLRVAFDNAGPSARGLPEIYNAAITEENTDCILLFVHDDVLISDFFIQHRLNDALQMFDVVGVAGCVEPEIGHSSWARRTDENGNLLPLPLQPNLSGAVAHVQGERAAVFSYGPTPLECRLLDGVLLAAQGSTLLASGARFDPELRFHFYDLDFCQACHLRGLRMGTYPIAINHWSGGAASEEWGASREIYWRKWNVRK